MLVVCVWAIAVAQIDLPVEFPVWGMIDQALFNDLIMDNGKAGAREKAKYGIQSALNTGDPFAQLLLAVTNMYAVYTPFVSDIRGALRHLKRVTGREVQMGGIGEPNSQTKAIADLLGADLQASLPLLDYANAVQWWESAAERNDGMAQLFVGRMHRLGIVYDANESHAMEWYNAASVTLGGRGFGQRGLARLFLKKMYPEAVGQHRVSMVGRDVSRAAKWFRAAADEHNDIFGMVGFALTQYLYKQFFVTVEYLERALAFEVSQRGKLVQAELEQQAEIEKRTADYSMLVAAELANGTSLQNSTLTALAAERDFRVQQYAAQLAAARQVFNAHNYSAPGATIAKVMMAMCLLNGEGVEVNATRATLLLRDVADRSRPCTTSREAEVRYGGIFNPDNRCIGGCPNGGCWLLENSEVFEYFFMALEAQIAVVVEQAGP